LDSVAPEVKTISPGEQPSSAATCSRARSTRAAAAQPNAWALCGLPKWSVSARSMTSITAGSTGVVAWWSR